LRDSSAKMLADICTIKKVKLTTVNIEDPNSPMSETEVSVGIDIDKVLSGINHEFDSVKGDNIEMAISRYVDMNDIDLIVTIPRQESWLTRLFNPSVSKKLAQHEYRPLLALAH
jgi:K+-sensing histidine kinase KdpD